jgi:choline dehydrogenase-like flavoprotein
VSLRPRRWLKGAVRPPDNDSAFLLHPHRRAVPQADEMRRFRDDDEVDLVVVGAGAGGSVLAQRLARRGWRIAMLEAGPFWDPDRDWVSDEAGAHDLYWTEPRVIGGDDPVELGKNNSGRGVGGSMVHYAGYAPRFHPSDFETKSRDGVGHDWPISYGDLKPHYERLELELPVAGQDWPWGDPHAYPHAPHPVGGAAERAMYGARQAGIEMRVGPVAIVNGTFGNRPHCIYRGFCLQGCKVGAKASPLVTHLPDALAHGVEVRAGCMVSHVEIDAGGRATGVRYIRDGRERFQRAAAVAVAAYSIETPRLLLRSTSAAHPNGIGNHADALGRYVMVQGAPQVAGRFPETLRMYKGAAARGLERAVLRDRPAAGLRPRVLDPDREPAADRLGRARARRRPLGYSAAGVHARLQPLDRLRRAVRAAPASRQPRHAGR